MQELAQDTPEPAEAYEIRGRLQLPGGRWVEFKPGTAAPGQTLRWAMTREFLYPNGYEFAHQPPKDEETSFAYIPTTPTGFDTQQLGVEIELDVEPLGGVLIIGGAMRHCVFAAFGMMTGEAFSPITAPAIGPDGSPVDIVLTDNQVLLPRFATHESPFTVSAAPGTLQLIPVRMAFGATFLEITCRPTP